jgi:hypothetical protein
MPESPRGQLNDPRFRAAMLSKLESLIAVLELARAKADGAMHERPQEICRLKRVLGNLEKTLEVCRRAHDSLSTPALQHTAEPSDPSHRQFIESMNFAEYRRLSKLPALAQEKISPDQLEDLCRRLASL